MKHGRSMVQQHGARRKASGHPTREGGVQQQALQHFLGPSLHPAVRRHWLGTRSFEVRWHGVTERITMMV